MIKLEWQISVEYASFLKCSLCTLKNLQARKNGDISEWRKNKGQVWGCDGFGISSDDEWLLEMKIHNFLPIMIGAIMCS